MRRLRHALLPAALVLAACAQPAAQGNDWQLDGETSSVGFVSIKSGEIAEAHHFTTLAGSVAEDGSAELLIALDSVETGIDIRNERMREHLFQTGEYPQARLTAQIDLAALEGLEPGQRTTLPLQGTLELHGVSLPVETEVTVTDLNGERVLVETTQPVLLHADDFGLTDGLATLQDLAGLPSITPVVPVTASLVFERE